MASVVIPALVVIARLLGLLAPWPYQQGTENWAMQAQGHDLGNLIAVAVLVTARPDRAARRFAASDPQDPRIAAAHAVPSRRSRRERVLDGRGTVLIDWESVGPGPVSDLASLLFSSIRRVLDEVPFLA
ncbi:MAG TPA: hypothetical protein VGO88_07430 [Mycetocola sp.]|jgi:thiamine kinase-like enzyme|nr:hypothetical protein [Mycetocola sp.]